MEQTIIMMYLRKANTQDIKKEWEFTASLPADENGFINDWAGVSLEVFETAALPTMLAQAEGRELPEGWVPQTCFFLWNDDEIVGLFHLRHFLCESLVEGGGHIGYSIGAEFRDRGYGTAGLGLALEIAHQVVPEKEIYLRVRKNNPASLKVMMKNVGYIHHEDTEHYFVRVNKR